MGKENGCILFSEGPPSCLTSIFPPECLLFSRRDGQSVSAPRVANRPGRVSAGALGTPMGFMDFYGMLFGDLIFGMYGMYIFHRVTRYL